MKYCFAILLLALVAIAMAAEKTPEKSQTTDAARDKRGLAYSHGYGYPYAYAPYSPYAYSAYNLPYNLYSSYPYTSYPYSSYPYNYPYHYNTLPYHSPYYY